MLFHINIRIRSIQIWFVGSGFICSALNFLRQQWSIRRPPSQPRRPTWSRALPQRSLRRCHRPERKMERGHLHSGSRTERTGKLLPHRWLKVTRSICRICLPVPLFPRLRYWSSDFDSSMIVVVGLPFPSE